MRNMMRGFLSFLKGWNAIAVWGMQHIATWRVGFAFTGPCCFGLKFRKLAGVQSRAWWFFWPTCPPPPHTQPLCAHTSLFLGGQTFCAVLSHPSSRNEFARKHLQDLCVGLALLAQQTSIWLTKDLLAALQQLLIVLAPEQWMMTFNHGEPVLLSYTTLEVSFNRLNVANEFPYHAEKDKRLQIGYKYRHAQTTL